MTEKDLEFIRERGSDAEAVRKQLNRFETGFPYLKIVAPAVAGSGICVLDDAAREDAIAYFRSARVDGKCKFVPASGAASRMFKDLFSGREKLSSGESIEGTPAAVFCENIKKFAFYDEALFDSDSPEDILDKTLTDKGLSYGSKPKAVIKFHSYPDGSRRSALAEHFIEALDYMRNEDGRSVIVVTISPEHEKLFVDEIKNIDSGDVDVKLTYQDKATDTIAVDSQNRPFRTSDGSLLFRPAGHGALIHNLNAVDSELVSIKNIDNVASEKYLPVCSLYKKVLMGKALELRDMIHGFLHALDEATGACIRTYAPYPMIPGINPVGRDEEYMSEDVQLLCNDIEDFLLNTLCIRMPESADCRTRVNNLRKKLNRPIRVCGMVRNQGDAGGGPFIIENKDGSTSLQILEGAQIDKSDPVSAAALKNSTHFNPVDIVCCLKDYKGEKFNLPDFVDEDTGFISSKSYQGRELKALELPGLWNGSMSDWNTLFVEVPLETFNPVKTVLDLLRPAHQ